MLIGFVFGFVACHLISLLETYLKDAKKFKAEKQEWLRGLEEDRKKRAEQEKEKEQ